jgi:hypothetical protein
LRDSYAHPKLVGNPFDAPLLDDCSRVFDPDRADIHVLGARSVQESVTGFEIVTTEPSPRGSGGDINNEKRIV